MPSRSRRNAVPLTEEQVEANALGIRIPHKYRPSPKTEAFVRRIRLVATELFAEHGLHNVSLADVSYAADLGPTHLQYYFGKREYLLYDILWDHLESLLQTANEAVARNQDANDGPAWTRDLVLALLRDVTELKRDAHRVLLHTLHVIPKVQRDMLEQRLSYLRTALAQPLAVAAGLEWTDPRLDPLAYAVLAMIGGAATWFPHQDGAALQAHAELIAVMALEGTRALGADGATGDNRTGSARPKRAQAGHAQAGRAKAGRAQAGRAQAGRATVISTS